MCSKSRCSLVLTARLGIGLSSSRKAAGEKCFKLGMEHELGDVGSEGGSLIQRRLMRWGAGRKNQGNDSDKI
jgi:hypothetical protein